MSEQERIFAMPKDFRPQLFVAEGACPVEITQHRGIGLVKKFARCACQAGMNSLFRPRLASSPGGLLEQQDDVLPW